MEPSPGWSTHIVPSERYSELSGTVSNPKTSSTRRISINTKGAKLNELMNEGEILTITGAKSVNKTTQDAISPLPLSANDARRAFYRIELVHAN
jgi:hypothetical protein